MARIVTKIGDVFLVRFADGTSKYFQYVATDRTMLGSSVIRAFKRSYPTDEKPALDELVKSEVDFYAHCVLSWGISDYLWEKIGRVPDVGPLDVIFRTSRDMPMKLGQRLAISSNWQVWRISEPRQRVGRLSGENRKAELGVVVAGPEIVERMRTGRYTYFYPGFE